MGVVSLRLSICCFMVYECVMNGVFIIFILSVFCSVLIVKVIGNVCLYWIVFGVVVIVG